MSGEAFSESSAQNTRLAASEAREWIEAVTGKKFKNDSIRESLEDGVLLCELMNKVNPGFIRKINKSKSPIAYLDNIRQFLNGCQDLGMKDAQLFDTMDLQNTRGGRKTGVKRDEADRRIRAVCIALFWLGRTVAELEEYDGPQLDLELFKRLMEGKLPDQEQEEEEKEEEVQYEEEEVVVKAHTVMVQPQHSHPAVNQTNHLPVHEETGSPTPTAMSNDSITTGSSQENGLPLTFEQEQSADELLADIQNAVDEMLENFQFTPATENPPQRVPPKPLKKPDVKKKNMLNGTPEMSQVTTNDRIDSEEVANHQDSVRVVKMQSRNGGFGFQVMGGMDSNIPAQVDYIVPGSAAKDSGLMEGDILVSVNGEDVSSLSHADLVGAIKKAGTTGEVILGVKREVDDVNDELTFSDAQTISGTDMTDHTPIEEPSQRHLNGNESFDRWEEENRERMRQAEEIALLYPQRNGGAVDVSGTNGPPPAYGREPLETLVEHQEEAMFEQIQEMMKVSSPPQSAEPLSSSMLRQRSHSETPPTNQSPFMPASPIQDDMESIEREIQELELMAAENNHPQLKDNLSDSTNEEESDDIAFNNLVGMKKIVADSGAVKFNSFEVTESNSPLPMSPISQVPLQVEIRQIETVSPRRSPTPSPLLPLHPDDVPDTNGLLEDSELSLDEQVNELLKLSASTSAAPQWMAAMSPPPTKVAEETPTSPPAIFSPIPPKPTAAAPKRAKRPAPPPPKNRISKAKNGDETTPSAVHSGSAQTTTSSMPEPGHVPTNTWQFPIMEQIPSPPLTTSPQPVATVNGAAVSPVAVSPAVSPQERTLSPEERTLSPEERTLSPQGHSHSPQERPLSPQEHTYSPQEHTYSPQEHTYSPQERTLSPQERTLSPQEPAVSPQEPAVSPHHEPVISPAISPQELSTGPPEPSLSPQELSTIPQPFAGLQESAATVPEPDISDPFSSPLRSPSPLQDTFTTPSMLRSDSPDLLTQMQQLAFSKNMASGLADIKAPTTSSNYTTSQMTERNSQPDQSQMQHSTHVSNSPSKPHSDSSLKFNGPVAVVAPPINTKLIGSNSPDGGDVSGGIKIQRVQKTRWTPRSNSHEQGSPSRNPDQVVPSLTPQHQRPETSAIPREDRCATLPNMRYQNAKHNKVSPSRDRRGHDQAAGPVVVARGIGMSGGIGISQDTKRAGGGQPPRTNGSNPYQPRNLQQVWKSHEELRNQRVNPSVQKKATTPDGAKVLGVKQSYSFSQGPTDGPRNRSKTWSPQVQDGLQVVHTVHPNNPYDLCSRCHQPLGQDNILSVPALRTQYHPKCLTCRVCKIPLSVGAKNTTILMKNKQPHCKSCGSSDGNTLTTEC